MEKEELNALSGKILHGTITVHKKLGPGLIERHYTHE
jgi:hypothetical protein